MKMTNLLSSFLKIIHTYAFFGLVNDMLTCDYVVVIAILCLHNVDTRDIFCWSWAIDNGDYDLYVCHPWFCKGASVGWAIHID
jgi:hypothetical protein